MASRWAWVGLVVAIANRLCTVIRSGRVDIVNQFSIPRNRWYDARSGARSESVISTGGRLLIGRPERYGVIVGDDTESERPIALTIWLA